jgi:hypothetical protein
MSGACGTYGRQDRYKTGFLWRDHLGHLGVDGQIILEWTFKKWDGEAWSGLIWLRIGTGDSACECGNEPSSSIKRGEFLD